MDDTAVSARLALLFCRGYPLGHLNDECQQIEKPGA
jgi:hypothetical protein